MSSLNSLCLSAQSEKRHTVRGYISDARSSESVISAGICCGKEGCISNEFGFWTMNLPEGKRTLTFSSVGYALEEITINLLKDTVLNVRMQPDATLEAAVIVSYAESGPAATRPGAITLPNELIKGAPALGGEPDVLKTMQLLPGVDMTDFQEYSCVEEEKMKTSPCWTVCPSIIPPTCSGFSPYSLRKQSRRPQSIKEPSQLDTQGGCHR